MDLSGYALTILHEDADFVLWRGVATASPSPHSTSILVSMPTSEHPDADRIRMLEHEWALRADLDSSWALRPLALGQHQGRAALILENQPGEPLERLLDRTPVSSADGPPRSAEPAMELGLFLRLAGGLAAVWARRTAEALELGSAAVSHVVDGRKARQLPLNSRD